jgi:hypothetical protein
MKPTQLPRFVSGEARSLQKRLGPCAKGCVYVRDAPASRCIVMPFEDLTHNNMPTSGFWSIADGGLSMHHGFEN